MGSVSTAHSQQDWSNAFLDSMRQTCDPLADGVIERLFAQGSVPAVNAMMRTLVENDGAPPAELPEGVREYLAESARLPEWADPARMKLCEEVFWRYGPVMMTSLLCYSLPYCYAGRKGVQVLHLTGRLHSNPTRRVIETAQMLVDVLKPGGLSDGGGGIRTAQKVRLMHAGVRHQVRVSGQWNPEWDEPINQEDLAGVLMSFSWVMLDGMRKLGITVTDEEAEAYVHGWNVIGWVIGVREELLPRNVAAAKRLGDAIARRQFAGCKEGREMNAALVGMLQRIVPGDMFDFMPEMLMRRLLSNEWADMLGVRYNPRWRLAMIPLRLANRVAERRIDRDRETQQVVSIYSARLIEALVWVTRGGRRIPFTIPTELRQTWGVNWKA
jgi:hypothetical protein